MKPCLDPSSASAATSPSSPFCYTEPSFWVVKGVELLREEACLATPKPVLDLACGAGRHSDYLLAKGFEVVAADKNVSYMAEIAKHPKLTLVEVDLEEGAWPWPDNAFAAIVVTNYLHRPLFPHLFASLAPGGLLIYETFTTEHTRRYGRLRRPEHVLEPQELKTLCAPWGACLAYAEEETEVNTFVAHGIWRKLGHTEPLE